VIKNAGYDVTVIEMSAQPVALIKAEMEAK
jgi:hypothetical protein